MKLKQPPPQKRPLGYGPSMDFHYVQFRVTPQTWPTSVASRQGHELQRILHLRTARVSLRTILLSLIKRSAVPGLLTVSLRRGHMGVTGRHLHTTAASNILPVLVAATPLFLEPP